MSIRFLSGQTLAFFLLLLAAGAVLFHIYVYAREARLARHITWRQQALLRVLRIVVAVLAVAALARPAVVLVRHEQRLPVAPLLVDESLSMAYADSRDNPLAQTSAPDKRRRYDTAQTAVVQLARMLAQSHRVKVFTFSDALKLLKELPPRQRESDPAPERSAIFEQAPNPTGEYTNIGDALTEALRVCSGDRVSGIVLFTDGRQTGGMPLRDAAAQAAAAKVPVHTVVLGTEFPLRDLRIDEVIAEPEVSLGDVLRFRAKITNQISAPLRTTLTLLEEKQKVNEREITLRRGENYVEIATIPETEGLREFRLVLPVYDDLATKDGNEAVVHVKVVKRSLRVLLIAGNPSRDYFYLVPALLRDPVVDLSCWLQSADIDYTQQGQTKIERLPRSVDEWKKYDVVLLYDVDPNKITTQQIAEMENMVRTGGGLMVIAGRSQGLAKLIQVHAVKVRELLPVEVDKNALPDYFQTFETAFACARTPMGRGHPILRLDRDDKTNEAVWAAFPKFYWAHPVTSVKPKSIVLLQRSDGIPLMAIHRYYEGAVFYSGLDSLWRWRYPHASFDYDRFWSNVIRYLGETRLKGAQQQVALSTDRNSYAPGEEVVLKLRVLDPALMAQLAGQTLLAAVTTSQDCGAGILPAPVHDAGWKPAPQGERQMAPLRAAPSGEMLYTGSYRARRTGSLLARASHAAPGSASDAKPLFDVSCPFLVKLQSLEARDTSGDLEAMRNLAQQTGGLYLDYHGSTGLNELAKAIPADPQVLSQEITLEVWDGTLFLLIFLVFIGAEWSLRKCWGLL